MSDLELTVAGEPSDALRIDLDRVDKDIRGGLESERARLLECRKNQVYYDGDNDGEIPSRQAEDRLDYDQRPKRVSYLTRKVIRGLAGHTYCPGPTRRLGAEGDAAGDALSAWLERVYQDNDANSLWAEADRMATLHGVSAFQVAATGRPEKPIRLHVWTAEELAVWCPDDDVLCPQAVCTITQSMGETLYTLYTAAFVRRYRTRKSAWGMERSLIAPEGDDEPNPYGRLPFSWVHFERPTRKFWPKGVGTLIRKVNAGCDEEKSELAEALRFYLKPVPLASGVPPGWRLKIQPGRFTIVPYAPGPNGAPRVEPKVWFLQANVDFAAALQHINASAEMGLSDLDVPIAAYRAEQTSAKSGAAMVTEQKPLLDYARARRFYYGGAPEKELAKLVAAIGGSYYDWSDGRLKAALLKESEDPHLALTWPDDLSVPTMEEAGVQAQNLDLHLTSRIKEIMRERGFTRAQAGRELAEIVADEAWYQQMAAKAGLPQAAPSQDDPAAAGDDGQADPEVARGVPGYVREGDAVVPLRDTSTPDPASSPGAM